MKVHGGRDKMLLVAVVALTGLIYGGCEPGPGTPTEQPESGPSVDPNAGGAWRLVRQGGGFVSPEGDGGQALQDVVWGSGRFVAVGDDGTIVHSGDGDRWSPASQSATSYWRTGIAWNDSRFVAVGLLGTVYSSDGDSWTEASESGTSAILFDIVWGGDRFVAVGTQGAIVSSEDGDRWTPASDSATTKQLNGVAWNGTQFVAVGLDGTIVHSSDGQHWSAATDSATSVFLTSVVAVGRRFVAVGRHTIVHSEDGDRWTVASSSTPSIVSVVWDGARFVALAGTGLYTAPMETTGEMPLTLV